MTDPANLRYMEPFEDDILTSFLSQLAQKMIPPTAQANEISGANTKSPTLSLWQSGSPQQGAQLLLTQSQGTSNVSEPE